MLFKQLVVIPFRLLTVYVSSLANREEQFYENYQTKPFMQLSYGLGELQILQRMPC